MGIVTPTTRISLGFATRGAVVAELIDDTTAWSLTSCIPSPCRLACQPSVP